MFYSLQGPTQAHFTLKKSASSPSSSSSSFPSKNCIEISLIFCTSSVLETNWAWDPFAFPNFFFIHLLFFFFMINAINQSLLCPFWSFPTFLKDEHFLIEVSSKFFHLIIGEGGSSWLNYFIILTYYQFFGGLFLNFLKKFYPWWHSKTKRQAHSGIGNMPTLNTFYPSLDILNVCREQNTFELFLLNLGAKKIPLFFWMSNSFILDLFWFSS